MANVASNGRPQPPWDSLALALQPRGEGLQGMLDALALSTSPVPGVGDVAGLASDAYRFATDASSRTWGNAGWASLGLIPFVPSMGAATRAYHATNVDFDKLDFSKLGRRGSPTWDNVTDTDPNSWAMRLARLGAWFSADDISSKVAAPISKQADLHGKAKSFGSLDKLSAYIERSGGSIKARMGLRKEGYDLVKVKDEEFGTTSYVALHPRAVESLTTKTR